MEAFSIGIFPLLTVWIFVAGRTSAQYQQMVCDSLDARQARKMAEPGPNCDMNERNWCTVKTDTYPEDKIMEIILDNRGIMKRLFGDVREARLLEMEFGNHFGSDTPPPPPPRRPKKKGNVDNDSLEKKIRAAARSGKKISTRSRNGINLVESNSKFNKIILGEKAKNVGNNSSWEEISTRPNDKVFSSGFDVPVMPTQVPSNSSPTEKLKTPQIASTLDIQETSLYTTEPSLNKPTEKNSEITSTNQEMQDGTSVASSTEPKVNSTEANVSRDTARESSIEPLETTSFSAPPLDLKDDLSYSQSTPKTTTESQISVNQTSQPTLTVKPNSFRSQVPQELPFRRQSSRNPSASPQRERQPSHTQPLEGRIEVQQRFPGATIEETVQRPPGTQMNPSNQNRPNPSGQNRQGSVDGQHRQTTENQKKPGFDGQQRPSPGRPGNPNNPTRVGNDGNRRNREPIKRPTPKPNPGDSSYLMDKFPACNSTSELIAPTWAKNLQGKNLIVVNVGSFMQHLHIEECEAKALYRRMFCQRGCRCEQQYRLQKLLVIDPNDECRGIFSDWFRFPSCCVCVCYPASWNRRTAAGRDGRIMDFNDDYDEDYDYYGGEEEYENSFDDEDDFEDEDETGEEEEYNEQQNYDMYNKGFSNSINDLDPSSSNSIPISVASNRMDTFPESEEDLQDLDATISIRRSNQSPITAPRFPIRTSYLVPSSRQEKSRLLHIYNDANRTSVNIRPQLAPRRHPPPRSSGSLSYTFPWFHPPKSSIWPTSPYYQRRSSNVRRNYNVGVPSHSGTTFIGTVNTATEPYYRWNRRGKNTGLLSRRGSGPYLRKIPRK